MPLFQAAVLRKYLKQQDSERVSAAYAAYRDYFHNAEVQANIREAKEEQFQEGFLRELFVKVLHSQEGEGRKPAREKVTKELYKEYSAFKNALWQICACKPPGQSPVQARSTASCCCTTRFKSCWTVTSSCTSVRTRDCCRPNTVQAAMRRRALTSTHHAQQ